MNKIECFKIQIVAAESPFEFANGRIIKEVLCDSISKLRKPTTIVADPFLFVKDDTLYLFYEDKKMYRNGVISMISTKDLATWTEPLVVLQETCHLSYPWVFEENGQVYMIPETCGLKEIRLYRANDELTDFKYTKTILRDDTDREDGLSFSDTSILKKDDAFYLMTTVNENKTNILKLYVSDNFDSSYIEHPNSPIVVGNKYGRNGGCLLEFDGKLLRVAQDCVNRYGDNVHLLEVKVLNKEKYKEESIKDYIIPTTMTFYKEGGHQFNFVKFKGKYVIATDAKEYHGFAVSRILHKIGMYR